MSLATKIARLTWYKCFNLELSRHWRLGVKEGREKRNRMSSSVAPSLRLASIMVLAAAVASWRAALSRTLDSRRARFDGFQAGADNPATIAIAYTMQARCPAKVRSTSASVSWPRVTSHIRGGACSLADLWA
jgi:hypothetical protein